MKKAVTTKIAAVLLATLMAHAASAQLYGGGVQCTVPWYKAYYYAFLGVDPSFGCH